MSLLGDYVVSVATIGTFAWSVANAVLTIRNMINATPYIKDDQLKIDAILKYVEDMHKDMQIVGDDGLKIWYFPSEYRTKINTIVNKVSSIKDRLKMAPEPHPEVDQAIL